MSNPSELIQYRLEKAWETLEAAEILGEHQKWNSAINRLYYAVYYATMALLLKSGLKPATHTGAKSNLSEHFIKTGVISKDYGRMYSQLFSWRQKGDYDDLFDFDKEKVESYYEPVKDFIILVTKLIDTNAPNPQR